MKDTYTEANKDVFDILIQGHNAKGEKQGPWTQNGFEGAGVIKSTVANLLKFLCAHMNNTLGFFEMTHFEKYHIGEGEGIGLNWFISQKHGWEIIWHDGATGGYASFAGFNKEKHIAVVVLSNYINSVNSIGFDLLADRIQMK